MTFLAPSLLFLGLAAAVPLILHLLQRHHGPRMVFPALRYLRRAEREHATRIRLRQVLLLALRVLALLLLAAAAARPVIRGAGTGHEPTAVVIVLDNSMSTGAVVGDRLVLDRLRDAALETLEAAGPDDRFWLIRAGAPWEPAMTGEPASLAEALRTTRPSGGGADLAAEIERATSILAGEPAERAREIHVLTDLQAAAFRPARPAAAGAPTIVLLDVGLEPPGNRAVTAVEVGGGLPPRAGERSTITAGVARSGELTGNADDSVTARLVLDGSVRAAATVVAGAAAVLPFPARAPGIVTGHVEIDADALHADDRRYFVARVTPPPGVALTEPLPFLEEAVSVLEEANRLRRVSPGAADVVLAPGAAGAEAVRRGTAVLVLPPASPLELAAANQRLAGAGIPWRFGPSGPGESRFQPRPAELGDVLADVRLRQVYDLEPQTGSRDTVLLRLSGGEPWALAGSVATGGRYVILASPLTADGGTIPTSAVMLPLLDRMISAWAMNHAPPVDYRPGDVVTLPAADSILNPAGRAYPVRAGAVHRLERIGVYQVLRDGETVAAYAVNPPPEESDLRRLDPAALDDLLPGRELRVAGPGAWVDTIFRQRLGREITWPLVLLALALLLVELAVAAAGSAARRTAPEPMAAGVAGGQ